MEIFIVMSHYPYESTEVSGVFLNLEKAEQFVKEQADLCGEYRVDQKLSDYSSDLESPKCLNEDMEIHVWEVDKVDHYGRFHKNLSLWE